MRIWDITGNLVGELMVQEIPAKVSWNHDDPGENPVGTWLVSWDKLGLPRQICN